MAESRLHPHVLCCLQVIWILSVKNVNHNPMIRTNILAIRYMSPWKWIMALQWRVTAWMKQLTTSINWIWNITQRNYNINQLNYNSRYWLCYWPGSQHSRSGHTIPCSLSCNITELKPRQMQTQVSLHIPPNNSTVLSIKNPHQITTQQRQIKAPPNYIIAKLKPYQIALSP